MVLACNKHLALALLVALLHQLLCAHAHLGGTDPAYSPAAVPEGASSPELPPPIPQETPGSPPEAAAASPQLPVGNSPSPAKSPKSPRPNRSPKPAKASPQPSPEPSSVPSLPPPPPPARCLPLRGVEVVVPDLTLMWRGSLAQGLEGFALEFGGNVTEDVEAGSIIVDEDPTLPDGAKPSNAIMVTYEANVTGPGSGVNFFVYPFGSDLPLGDEVRLQYKVMFEDGFDFADGGTLPGLFQGPAEDNDTAQPCFGSWQPGMMGVDCFSIRPQWGRNATVELSMYVPKEQQPCELWKAADKRYDPNSGATLMSKVYRLTTLRWYLVDLYIKLNTVGQDDGAVLLSLNGAPLLSFPRLIIRTNATQTVQAMSFASYFLGGPNTEPDHEQHVLFKDFRLLLQPPGSPSPLPEQPSPSPSPEQPSPSPLLSPEVPSAPPEMLPPPPEQLLPPPASPEALLPSPEQLLPSPEQLDSPPPV